MTGKNYPICAQDFDLWELLNRVYHLISRYRENELRQYNIHRSQVYILWTVKALGNKATIMEISRHGYHRPNATSQIIKKMVAKGLLIRDKIGTGEKKRTIIRLTEKGICAYNNSIAMNSIHKIMATLNKEQRKHLQSCLELLLDNVTKLINYDQSKFYLPSQLLPHVKALY